MYVFCSGPGWKCGGECVKGLGMGSNNRVGTRGVCDMCVFELRWCRESGWVACSWVCEGVWCYVCVL